MGLQGNPGPTGPAGADGTDGATGPTGAQGPKGDTGDTGPMGAQGPKGDTGDSGSGASTVSSDATLSGDGSSSSPLGVVTSELDMATGSQAGIIGSDEFVKINNSIDAAHLHDTPALAVNHLADDDAFLLDDASVSTGSQLKEISVSELDKRWNPPPTAASQYFGSASDDTAPFTAGFHELPSSVTGGRTATQVNTAIESYTGQDSPTDMFDPSRIPPNELDSVVYDMPVTFAARGPDVDAGGTGLTLAIPFTVGAYTFTIRRIYFDDDDAKLIVYFNNFGYSQQAVLPFAVFIIGGVVYRMSQGTVSAYVGTDTTREIELTRIGAQPAVGVKRLRIYALARIPMELVNVPSIFYGAQHIALNQRLVLWNTDSNSWGYLNISELDQRWGDVPRITSLPVPLVTNRRYILLQPDTIDQSKSAITLQSQTTQRNVTFNEAVFNGVRGYISSYTGLAQSSLAGNVVLSFHSTPASPPNKLFIGPRLGNQTEYAVSNTIVPSFQHHYLVTGLNYDDLAVGTRYYVNVQFADGTWEYAPVEVPAADITALSPQTYRFTPGTSAMFAETGNAHSQTPVEMPAVLLPEIPAEKLPTKPVIVICFIAALALALLLAVRAVKWTSYRLA